VFDDRRIFASEPAEKTALLPAGLSLAICALASVDSPRGEDYLRDRYQRMALFIVPVLQWVACLAIGSALSVDVCWKWLQSGGGRGGQ
jgi:hypothetical protein